MKNQETGRGWDSPEAAKAHRDDLLEWSVRVVDPNEAADLRQQAKEVSKSVGQ